MQSDAMNRRAIAFEDAFIRQVEAEQLRRSLDESGRQALRAELGAELEIAEEDPLLDDLLELGITPETAPAFQALPLVEVAWADGHIDEDECWRVLGDATAFGLELGRPGHAQLELWLTRRPNTELFDAWYRFAARGLSRPAAAARAKRVLEGAQGVAMAAGGLLMLGAVSRSERAAIARISQALRLPMADS